MVLELATSQPKREDRSIVPACLQERPPVRYELRDEHDRRVPPTLVGYCLRRGKRYRLYVEGQSAEEKGWKLVLIAPRRLIDVKSDEGPANHGRQITFEVLTSAPGEYLRWLQSQTADMEVRIEFEGAKEPFELNIPVIVLAARFRLVVYVLGAILTGAITKWWEMNWTVTGIANIVLVSAFLVLVVILASFIVDFIRFHKAAINLMRDTLQIESPSDLLPHVDADVA